MSKPHILQGIEAIIFDLGAVILNIDFEKPVTAFKNLGVKNFEKLYSQAIQSQLFDKLEMGIIDTEAFCMEFRAIAGLPISDKAIHEAWNSMIEDFPPERILLLQELSKTYRIFLLSNTNNLHYQYYNALFKQQYGYESLDSLFEQAFYSFRLGMRKPDIEIYKHVIKQSNLVPATTLFIDDSAINLVAPQQMGINTLQLTPNINLCEALQH